MQGDDEKALPQEKPKSFWRRVYVAVVIVTFLVITALWAFSKHFSV